MRYEFYVGSYTAAGTHGIYHCALEDETGKIELLAATDGIDNPSYLLKHPEHDVLYCVEELTPVGLVSCFAMADGELQYRKALRSNGADPCHLSLDPSGRFLLVANYTSGSLTVFRLDERGELAEEVDHQQHVGHSVNPERQNGAHVHFSQFVGGELYCVDLGEDRVYCYEMDPESGKLSETPKSFRVPDGYGPRHIAAHPGHPDRLYVMTEMAAKVLVYQLGEDRRYALVQTESTLPEDARPEEFVVGAPGSLGAAIKFTQDGTLLIASTRGHNSLAVFRVEKDGRLRRLTITASGGRTPRDFGILGDTVVVANQDSDVVTSFALNRITGELTPTGGSLRISKPVCILPAQRGL